MSNLWTMAAVMAVLAGLTAGCDEAPAGPATLVVDSGGRMVGDGGGTDMGVTEGECSEEQVAACTEQNEESICRLHGEVASCDLPCEDSNECPGDTRCGLDGLCANACEDDEDCTNGDVCEGGACVIPNMGDMGMMDGPDGGMADDCGGACGNGTECREGRCVAVENLCGGVVCGEGLVCRDDECVPNGIQPHETNEVCNRIMTSGCWDAIPLFGISLTDANAVSEAATGNWRIAAMGPGVQPLEGGCRWHGESRPEITEEGLAMGPTDAITCEDSARESFGAQAFIVLAGVEITSPPEEDTYEVLAVKQATPDGWTEGERVGSNLDNFMLGRVGNQAFCKFETERLVVVFDNETTNPTVLLDLPDGGMGMSAVWSCKLLPTNQGSKLILQVGEASSVLDLPANMTPLMGRGGLQIGGPDLVSDHNPDRLRGATVRTVIAGRLEWKPEQ